MKFFIGLFTALLFSSSFLFSQAGTLDPSFDGDGIAWLMADSTHSYGVCGTVVQPDGKIIVAGTAQDVGADFVVIRFNPDGSLDNTFDSDGRAQTDIAGNPDVAYGLALQSDGKIVVVGTTNTGLGFDFAIVRYNSNGSLDNTFNGDGKLTTDFDVFDTPNAVAIQSDGKIVVAGYTAGASASDFALARYDSGGNLDNSFDGDGKLTTAISITNDDDNAYAVAIQPDGKILAAGSSTGGVGVDFAICRYNTDGTMDNTFDSDGILVTPIGTSDDVIVSIALTPDNRITAGGKIWNGSDYDFGAARYTSTGAFDNSFSTDGKTIVSIGASTNDICNDMILQPDGKMLLGGYSYSPAVDFAMIRIDSLGNLDNSFDLDGKVVTPIGIGDDFAYGLGLQPDGKIVMAGHIDPGGSYHVAVARYYSGLVGMDEEVIGDICLYPNPVLNELNVEYNLVNAGSIVFGLTNVQGQLLTSNYLNFQEAGKHVEKLEMGNLPTGIYYLRVISPGGGTTLKLVKQ